MGGDLPAADPDAGKELRALQQVAELPEWRELFAAREGQLQGH